MELQECVNRAERGQLRLQDVADGPARALPERLDAIARQVALRYLEGERGHAECYHAMDTLYHVMHSGSCMPDFGFNVWFAFCVGCAAEDRWHTRRLLVENLGPRPYPAPIEDPLPC